MESGSQVQRLSHSTLALLQCTHCTHERLSQLMNPSRGGRIGCMGATRPDLRDPIASTPSYERSRQFVLRCVGVVAYAASGGVCVCAFF